ncbi:MAG TPA: hypothetical protein ENJ56_02690 [Anaerolineae bacterium]|nr:hypothetical protein [Anaerolineae bacterium]
MLNWGEDHGAFANTPGEFITVDLEPYRGSRSVTLRWRYHDQAGPSEKYYAQIDDIAFSCVVVPTAVGRVSAETIPHPQPLLPLLIILTTLLTATLLHSHTKSEKYSA